MSYYEALGFWREPFSNSPDPELLYRSRVHLDCLQQMEIAVRLRRGLNVVLGDVGTGKTTLGRELIRVLGRDETIDVHLLDDPYYPTPAEFLMVLLRLFGEDTRPLGRDMGLLRDALKTALLQKSDEGRRIVVLVIDEGQKITGACLELLRELLNFETNTQKLLQIVLFAQTEFEDALSARPNLDDRVNFRCRLRPLDRTGTRRLIQTRLALCTPDGHAPALFSALALRRIHRLSRGYPRKIVRLCHLSMLLAIGFGKKRIGWGLVGRADRQSHGAAALWLRRAGLAGAFGGLALLGLGLATPDFNLCRGAVRVLALTEVYLKARLAGPGAGGSHAVVAPLQDPVPVAAGLPTAPPTPIPAPSGQTGDALSPASVPAALEQPPALATASTIPDGATPVPEPAEQVIEVPAAESAPKAVAAAAPTPDAQGPSHLGSIPMRSGWPVTRLAAKIYGQGGRRALSALAKANPGVDFDRMRAGDSLIFPALAATPPPAGVYLVRVAVVSNLEEGYSLVDQYREKGPRLVVFSTYHQGSGLRFEVLLDARFADRDQAAAAEAGLPRALSAGAVLVDGYPDGTVYFTELGDQPGKRAVAKPADTVSGRQVAAGRGFPGVRR